MKLTTKRLSEGINANVVFFCHDGNGNFLMSLRGDESKDHKGVWDPGSGRVEVGETALETVYRELKEEYGVIPKDLVFMGVKENILDSSNWITFEYLVEVSRLSVKNMEPNKLLELGWYKYEDLPINKAHPLFKGFLERNHTYISKVAN